MNMIKMLVQIHAVDIDKVGLSDYGKKGKYLHVSVQANFFIIVNLAELFELMSMRFDERDRPYSLLPHPEHQPYLICWLFTHQLEIKDVCFHLLGKQT